MYLLQHLLARSAAATPDAAVIVSPAGDLTYGELDARSDQLARLLLAHGAGRGVPVAICVAKGPPALIGIFGILKSGSCYVPLDPVASPARAARILADAGAALVLVDEHSEAAVESALEGAALAAVRIRVDLDAPSAAPDRSTRAAAAAASADPLADRPLTDEDPAYVLYTSGSTGVPKGVALSHRAAMTFVRCCVETFGVGPGDRVSSHAPLTFDLSILDVFVTVAAGATIVPITGQALVFPRTLAQLINEQRITVWYSVPFALTQLLQHGGLERFSFEHLRTVLFAGEPLAVANLRALMEHWRHARWFNLYGPTETNVVTWYEVTRADAERLESLPIGGPWPNSEIRIVDDELREVPAGEPGELCVRGATTMTGYWGAEDDSAGAFVSLRVHPALAPRRFYRTGDVVRRDAHGLLWFLGRRDDMVKVRGHRVELAEVEAVLNGHPGLAEVAVVAVPHEQIGCELVAAATPVRGDGRPNARDVMAFCAARLPGFMQPRRVELLPSLPRTSTGKLDRRRLARELPCPRTPNE